jgi:hypothetical protein
MFPASDSALGGEIGYESNSSGVLVLYVKKDELPDYEMWVGESQQVF